MARVRVLHYRDHNNGGKFDGTCYGEDATWAATDKDRPIQFRIKFEAFASGSQYVWNIGGSGTDTTYNFQIVKSGDDYYPRVRYLDVDYDYTDVIILPGRYYTFKIKYSSGLPGNMNLNYGDKYASRFFLSQITYSSDHSTYTLGTGLRVGGRSGSTGFTGIVYDWETYETTVSDRYSLIFYEEYSTATSDEIPAYNKSSSTALKHLTITSKPDDFWSAETDLSDYFSASTNAKINRSTTEDFVQVFEQFDFTLFNIPITIGLYDSILYEISSDGSDWQTQGLFVVSKVTTSNLYYTKIESESFFTELSLMPSNRFFTAPNLDYDESNAIWWENAVYDDSGTRQDWYETGVAGTNYLNWYSLRFAFRRMMYGLQFDNILVSCTIPLTILSQDSLYYDYDNGNYIDYQDLVWNFQMMTNLNKTDTGNIDELPRMDEVLLIMLKVLRFKYLYDSGTSPSISFRPIDRDARLTVTDNNKFIYAPATELYDKYSVTTVGILQDATYEVPKLSDYGSSFTSSDIDDVIGQQYDFTLNIQEILKKEDFPNHFWLFYRDGTTINTMLNSSNSQSFLNQYALIVDTELRGEFNVETITTNLEEITDDDYTDGFYIRNDDMRNKTMTIKQRQA